LEDVLEQKNQEIVSLQQNFQTLNQDIAQVWALTVLHITNINENV